MIENHPNEEKEIVVTPESQCGKCGYWFEYDKEDYPDEPPEECPECES